MRTKLLLWSTLGILGSTWLAIQLCPTWLPWVARNLVVEDPLTRGDVIAVFAADEARGRHAADLYKRGLAARVLTTGELVSKSVYFMCGEKVTGAAFMAKVLMEEGVPNHAVVSISSGTSTYEEATAMKIFMERNGHRSLIAVSSPYHMRRVRATLSRILEGSAISVRYSPARDSDVHIHEWWRHEGDLIKVTNEYIKLAYYHLALF